MSGMQPSPRLGDWALAACAWVMSAGRVAAPGRSPFSLPAAPLGLQTVPGPADDEDEDEEEDEDDDAGGGGGNIEPDDDEGCDDEDDEDDDEEPWQVRAGRRGSAHRHADAR